MNGDYVTRNLRAQDQASTRPKGVALVDVEGAYDLADRCMAAVTSADGHPEPLDAYSWRLGVVATVLHLVGARQFDPGEEIAAYLAQGAAR